MVKPVRVIVDDEEPLDFLLKGKLLHVDASDYAKQIVSKIRSTDVRSRLVLQDQIWNAGTIDEVLTLIRP